MPIADHTAAKNIVVYRNVRFATDKTVEIVVLSGNAGGGLPVNMSTIDHVNTQLYTLQSYFLLLRVCICDEDDWLPFITPPFSSAETATIIHNTYIQCHT